MLVSNIISNARLLTNMPNTTTYTDNEALYAVQIGWEEMYAFMANADDDYFVTPLYVLLSSMTPDTSRTYTYLYSLPSDFYRLRLLQYQGTGGATLQFWPVYKMTIENFGNSQNNPGYRFEGNQIAIYDPVGYTTYAIWYYPKPATLTTATDITYPNSIILEILTYQVAIEICRKQRVDFSAWESRKAQLVMSLMKILDRDDNKTETIKNTFNRGFAPYI